MADKFGRFGGQEKKSPFSPQQKTRPTAPASSAGYPKKSGLSSFAKPDNSAQVINQQVAQWDFEMDSLDKQQEQLLNDQWKLLRTQIGSLMGALSEVKQELADLKGNVLSKEMEAVIENMVAAHDGHDKNHSSIFSRLDYLEGILGDSVDAKTHDQHRTTMEERMDYLEGLMGDNADKHMDALKKLNDAVDGCAKSEHHGTLEERIGYVEGFLGESFDKHAKDLKDHKAGWEDHKANMETRLEYLEALAGDSADKHAKEIEALKANHKDLHAAIKSCAKAEHHSSIDKRVGYLEKLLGESADKHDNHKTSMETRLEYLEGLLGDSAEKHAKEIEAAKGKLNDLHKAISSCAKSEHHSSLEKRMEYLEKCLGESADNHDNHKTTMEQRLEYIEALLGDSADKHAKEIDAAKGKLGDLHKAIAQCAKAEHHGDLEARVDKIERIFGDHKDGSSRDMTELKKFQDSYKKTMEQRLEYMENMLSSSSENKAKDINTKIEFNEARIRDIAQKVDALRGTNDSNKYGLEQRLNAIEGTVADSYGSGIMSRVEQRLAAIQEDQIRSQETFKHSVQMSIKEQIDMQNSALLSQNSQMRELWDREANSRHSSVENYKQLLMQERTSRDVCMNQLEERIMNLELNPNRVEILRQPPPQVITEVLPPVIREPTTFITGAMSPRMPLMSCTPAAGVYTGGSSVVVPAMSASTTRLASVNPLVASNTIL